MFIVDLYLFTNMHLTWFVPVQLDFNMHALAVLHIIDEY
jgi:hypothetical protein